MWTNDGLAEHASVASFSRFVLQCLAVGAPVDIVQGAQQACADEIEHARIAFGAPTSLDADTMRAHGYLAMDERRRIATAVIENVIRPAARALFARAESARAAACRCVA